MEFLIVIYLLILGLALGSFVNAFVWRIHKKETGHKRSGLDKKIKSNSELRTPNYSILKGRSMCPKCEHQLVWYDLVPLFSWLALKGKCRYCRRPISKQYPLIELLTAILFVVSYVFWPVSLDASWQIIGFAAWLLVLTGMVALLVYDYKWMILPDKITYPLILFTALTIALQFALGRPISELGEICLSATIGGGFFWIIYQISKGKWIGGGDVKLGLLIGLLVAKPVMMMEVLFLASLFGLVYVLPAIINKKAKTSTKIPFGPFLILATFIVVLFGQQLADLYLSLVLI